MSNHFQNRFDNGGDIGRFPVIVPATAELEQTLGDGLAAKRFLLNGAQVLGDGLAFAADARQDPRETPFERLAAKGDAGQRVVDFMCDAGGEETDARQTLRPHQ